MSRLLATLLLSFLVLPLSACQADNGSSTTPPATSQQPASSQTQDAPPPPPVAGFKAGEHYEVLRQPVRTSDPERIEVTEVFWYGCGHCFTFEPLVHEWTQTLDDDVVITRLPAIWHPTMELHAKAYFTAESLGVVDQVHKPIFEAMNLHRDPLDSAEAIAELFEANGVSREDFERTFDSFGINSAVRQADSRQRAFGVRGTPELIVNGKYRITGTLAGSHATMLQVADQLIEQERATR